MKAPHLFTLRIVEAEELQLAVLRQGARQVPDVSVHPDSTMSNVKAQASQVAVSPVSAKGSDNLTKWLHRAMLACEDSGSTVRLYIRFPLLTQTVWARSGQRTWQRQASPQA